jgi:DNA helicase-2/ATP-dependent DNA helicase PcrA
MTELQQRNEAFHKFLGTLNPVQREAVAQLEGPVLVVAGPGTGKTHLLTARIGNILLETDARAQNVLCLTFTDAGASAMRHKLLDRIGPEALRVPIFTFHAFCNRVIQDNAEYFSKGSPEPVTDLERIEIIRRILGKLPTEHPLRSGRKNAFQYEEHLRDLFSTMKKEGWTPGHVIKNADAFLKALPDDPRFIYQRNSKYFKKGDPKTAQIEAAKEKTERLKAAADLYPLYVQAMEQADRYEYEDMLLWVNRAFEKHEALLRSYQERYQYLLVDEFQDTNGAQFKLLNLMLDFWELPNIFIVGDDDQSIYEFQGARLQNLRFFQKRYENGLKTFFLEENYRSTAPILEAASRVIGHNLLRAVNLLGEGLKKNLRANRPDTGAPPLFAVLPSRLQETIWAAEQVESLIARGVPPKEIAVLYARHRQAERLLSILAKKGIPFQTKRPVNVLDLPLVQQLRALLCYLHDESKQPFSGEHWLFRLLHAPFWQLDPLDLAKLAAFSNRPAESSPEPYLQVGAKQKKRLHWRELLAEPAQWSALTLQRPDILAKTGQKLNRWVADAQSLPLPVLLERLLAESGLLQWALEHPERNRLLAVLHTFASFVGEEVQRAPRTDLGRLLGLLDSMDENRLQLPLKTLAQGTEGVQLLTAHAAKGLEFEHVFMLDCSEDTWDKDAGNNRGRFFLPETLTLSQSGEEDVLEARRRLFYVAMTRAKTGLYMSVGRSDDAGKALTQSQFLAETGITPTETSLPEETLQNALNMLLLETPPPVAELAEKELLDAALADFNLSITALNRFLRCPLAFYYEDVLKVPAAQSEAASYGLAMHGALQQFVLKMKAHKKMEWPGKEALGKMFQHEMERQRGNFTQQGFAQLTALGIQYLQRIHAEQVPLWRKRCIVERRIDRVALDGVPITGILDKIEWLDGGRLRIVDYKTGAPDPKKTAAPSEAQPFGGDYWRQLAFYKILLENARLYSEQVGKTAIAWLEPDKKGAFPIVEVEFSSTELELVRDLIRSAYERIRARDFGTGCGLPNCDWCQMHVEREENGLLRANPEESLDDA